MPLVIVHRDNLDCPAILCDHCGQPITAGRLGNYEWRSDRPTTPRRAYFAHKRCSRALEAAVKAADPQPDGWAWNTIDLALLPVYLARNLEVNFKDAEEWADLMASIL